MKPADKLHGTRRQAKEHVEDIFDRKHKYGKKLYTESNAHEHNKSVLKSDGKHNKAK